MLFEVEVGLSYSTEGRRRTRRRNNLIILLIYPALTFNFYLKQNSLTWNPKLDKTCLRCPKEVHPECWEVCGLQRMCVPWFSLHWLRPRANRCWRGWSWEAAPWTWSRGGSCRRQLVDRPLMLHRTIALSKSVCQWTQNQFEQSCPGEKMFKAKMEWLIK